MKESPTERRKVETVLITVRRFLDSSLNFGQGSNKILWKLNWVEDLVIREIKYVNNDI